MSTTQFGKILALWSSKTQRPRNHETSKNRETSSAIHLCLAMGQARKLSLNWRIFLSMNSWSLYAASVRNVENVQSAKFLSYSMASARVNWRHSRLQISSGQSSHAVTSQPVATCDWSRRDSVTEKMRWFGIDTETLNVSVSIPTRLIFFWFSNVSKSWYSALLSSRKPINTNQK